MIKIAILGPESTGKSELAQKLASHFGGEWVPEYAREYVEQLNAKYSFDDVCIIARKQIEEQQNIELENQPDYVFFDTELIITKIWFKYCFNQVPEFVENQLAKNYFDFYLLCDYDLEWIADPVREHGDDRQYFFELYKTEILKTGKPYSIVSGKGDVRLKNAVAAIKNNFEQNNTI